MICISDVSKMIRLLSTLENACDRKTFFDLLVDGFKDLLNITSALFLPYDQTKEIWSSEDALVYGLSSEILFEYLTRIHLMDPFVTSGWVKRNESRVALYVDFVSEEEFSRSEFAHEFLSRVPIRYGLCLKMMVQENLLGILELYRKQEIGNFGEREREIVDVLANPIASLLHRRLLLSHSDSSVELGIGFLVLGETGEILWSNQRGRRVIEDIHLKSLQEFMLGGHPRMIRSGGLSFRVRNIPMKTESTKFLKSGVTGQTGREVRILAFEPLMKGLQKKPPLESSGLTPKQKEIVIRVIDGNTNREIAKDLAISEQTVKDHLHDIFIKLGIRSRNELTIFFRL